MCLYDNLIQATITESWQSSHREAMEDHVSLWTTDALEGTSRTLHETVASRTRVICKDDFLLQGLDLGRPHSTVTVDSWGAATLGHD
ncbi:hypothetical protein OPT61_g4461 [Boeremia exigua]|uniref:Uncharacterized protein n=1 Tax=Boeremia exigua TaxID=749465 RepID=A0ACC2IE72_9PLEO|nr:hypothetical protein OPT61_g4461 [Boeremia exigua]